MAIMNETLRSMEGTHHKLVCTLSQVRTLQGLIAKNAIDPLEYSGEYEVVSLIDQDVELDTAKRYLNQNITVRAIPYAEVSNPSGGKTITIGG